MSDFCHLHVHTQYSLQDSIIDLPEKEKEIPEFIPVLQKYGMNAIAITDHSNMFGAVKFYIKCNEYKIKPVLGCELAVSDLPLDQKCRRIFPVVLLAKNNEGYKNLLFLLTRANLDTTDGTVRINKDLLRQKSKGLIGLSGSLGSEISQAILRKDIEGSDQIIKSYTDCFEEGDFYFELQANGLKEQNIVNSELIDLSKKHNIPLVATNDCHYISKSDAAAHQVIMCLQLGRSLDEKRREKPKCDGFYLKSPEEMKEFFRDVPEAISNTMKIAEMCNVKIELNTTHFPLFNLPGAETEQTYLKKLASDGLENRLANIKQVNPEVDEEKYRKRLDYELSVINKQGFAGYYLIVYDFISYAKNNGIPVGPGRGSGAGSLVAYAMKITDVDPIRFDLLFERFLNPERVSPPDFDVDFCKKKRHLIIDYIIKKYGRENVGQIVTFGSMRARSVIRDVGRVLAVPLSEVDRFAKMIPQGPLLPSGLELTLQRALQEDPQLEDEIKKYPQYSEILKYAYVLEKLPRNSSTHASGVVIADRPLSEYVPMLKGKDGEVATQFDMNDIAACGLLKFDILGLETLTLIEHATELIRMTNPDFDIEKVPMNDKAVFDSISKGETIGVFQLESRGFRELLRKMKPDCIEDVIAAVALYRPGPLGKSDNLFISRKHGLEKIHYPHPDLEDILKETYGTIVYQEQVMQIASKLAGFTLGQADLLRKAMGKKKPEVMAAQREIFVKGAVGRGIDEIKAKDLFEHIAEFAKYGFNKSHSAAYAILAYRTAYLKLHYPVRYMTALLTSEIHNKDKMVNYLTESKRMGISILQPDVNLSEDDFSFSEKSIRVGLSAVANVGEAAIVSIMEARKDGQFDSFLDFCERVDLSKVNRRVMESLVKSGAFDCFHSSRAVLFASIDRMMSAALHTGKTDSRFDTSQLGLFEMLAVNDKKGVKNEEDFFEKAADWNENQMLVYEKETLGFYVSGHPMDRYKKEFRLYKINSIDDVQGFASDRQVTIMAVLVTQTEKKTRDGNEKYATITVDDQTGQLECYISPKLFEKWISIRDSSEPFFIQGHISADNQTGSSKRIWTDNIGRIEEMRKALANSINIYIDILNTKQDTVLKMKEIFLENKGSCHVQIAMTLKDTGDVVLKPDPSWKINPAEKFIERIESLLGEGSVSIL